MADLEAVQLARSRLGKVTVTGKGSRAERLPLPAGAGTVIVAYLQGGRPAAATGRCSSASGHRGGR